MQTVKVGYGKSLDHYKTTKIRSENLDVEIKMENGDIVEVNTRQHGYAIRLVNKEGRKTLLDIDHKKIGKID